MYAFIYYTKDISSYNPITILDQIEAKNDIDALLKLGKKNKFTGFFYDKILDNYDDENDYKQTFAYKFLDIKSLGDDDNVHSLKDKIDIINAEIIRKYKGKKKIFLEDIRKIQDCAINFDIINLDSQTSKLLLKNNIIKYNADL